MTCIELHLCHLHLNPSSKLLLDCSLTIHPKNRISSAAVLCSGMEVLCIRSVFTIVKLNGTTAGHGNTAARDHPHATSKDGPVLGISGCSICTTIITDIGTTAGNGTTIAKDFSTIIKTAAMVTCTKHPLTPSVVALALATFATTTF